MYQITRKNRVKETLQLCHANGDVALEINVDLNVDEISGRVNSAYMALGAAQAALKEKGNTEKQMEAYGNAVLAVFEVIFGKEDTAKIVDFYEGKYTEMLLDMFPFINNEILPKIRDASAERREQLVEAAKAAQASNKAASRRRR